MSLMGKLKDWMGKNPDKAQGAIDKAGDFVDKRTEGKYSQHVDKAQDAARKYVGGDNPPEQQQQPPQQPPQQ